MAKLRRFEFLMQGPLLRREPSEASARKRPRGQIIGIDSPGVCDVKQGSLVQFSFSRNIGIRADVIGKILHV